MKFDLNIDKSRVFQSRGPRQAESHELQKWAMPEVNYKTSKHRKIYTNKLVSRSSHLLTAEAPSFIWPVAQLSQRTFRASDTCIRYAHNPCTMNKISFNTLIYMNLKRFILVECIKYLIYHVEIIDECKPFTLKIN